jgi:hypothetical protein
VVCHFSTGIWDLNLDFQSEFNSFTTAVHGEMELTLSHDIQPMKVKHFKSDYSITYIHIFTTTVINISVSLCSCKFSITLTLTAPDLKEIQT